MTTPDEIIDDFEAAVRRGDVGDAWSCIELMWADILEVIKGADAGRGEIPEAVTDEITGIVSDFLTNNYGD